MNNAISLSTPGVRRLEITGGAWLAAVLIALWPVWRWSVSRFLDGSDEAWGVVAIAALAAILWRDRASFTGSPRASWLLTAATTTVAAVVTAPWLPPLVRGVLASLAVTAALMAMRRHGHPMLPCLILALLSLPILSSLQFYLGYPLRVITAEASAVLLSVAGMTAVRSGSALTVNGALVIVDAPCSGIHMAWAAYFTACVTGAWLRMAAPDFLWRLSRVSAIVIAMNVLRNTVLVALECSPGGVSDFWHGFTGAIAFSVVCAATVWQTQRGHDVEGSARAGDSR